jgi:mono/diheme cytochrome c family protein
MLLARLLPFAAWGWTRYVWMRRARIVRRPATFISETPARCILALGLCGILAHGACSTRSSVIEGRALYHANGCANCHGADGHGDGPVGKTLSPPPRDFREAAAFKNGSDATAIAATLARGLQRDGAKMPRFDHLTEHERRAIAAFVMSLRDSATP